MNQWRSVALVPLVFLSTCTLSRAVTRTCTQIPPKLTCDATIPAEVPAGTHEVYINNYNNIPAAELFKHNSWLSVTRFDITSDLAFFYITDSNFQSLPNLTFLGIHARMKDINERAFFGLENIIELDLSGCTNIVSDLLVNALNSEDVLPRLQELNLARLSTEDFKTVKLNYVFWNMIKRKHVVSLSLRGANLLFSDIRGIDAGVSSLQYLDISNTTIFDGWNEIEGTKKWDVFKEYFTNVKVLNVSYIILDSIQTVSTFQNRVYNETCLILLDYLQPEIVYANKIFSEVFLIYNYNNTADYSKCNISSLKVLHMKNANLKKLNMTFIWPNDSSLAEVNLASNQMTYISDKLFTGLILLKTFVIRDNRLYEMESFPEFGDLLSNLSELELFDISLNKLTRIPKHMFSHTVNLRVLDLSGNRLQNIDFTLKHLKKIKILNLQKNRIKVIDHYKLIELNIVIDYKQAMNMSFTLVIQGNPTACLCENVDYLKWILHMQSFSMITNQTECIRKGETTVISTKVIEATQFSCFIEIIVLSTTIPCSVIAAVVIGYCIIRRMRRLKIERDRTKQKFKNDFKENKFQEQYLVFLSYCSKDDEHLVETVRTHLHQSLSEIIGLNEEQNIHRGNMVCSGDTHFRTGLGIAAESARLISKSFVTMCLVSNTFCQSPYCCQEIDLAFEAKKPIILVLLAEVDKNVMSKNLQIAFRQNVRTKLRLINGQYEPLQGWTSLCESVIMFACGKTFDETEYFRNIEIDDNQIID